MTGRAVTVRLDGETATTEAAADEYLLDVVEAGGWTHSEAARVVRSPSDKAPRMRDARA